MLPDINNILILAQKIFAVIGTIIYFIFALIIVKQTTTMSRNIKDKFNAILITASYIHLIFSGFLIILTFVIG